MCNATSAAHAHGATAGAQLPPPLSLPPPCAPQPAREAERILFDSGDFCVEAHLKLDDGRVLVLQVSLGARFKGAAQRFVWENSLERWFQVPLAKWLKKVVVEIASEPVMVLPVAVEGDLAKICDQFSRLEQGCGQRLEGFVSFPVGTPVSRAVPAGLACGFVW